MSLTSPSAPERAASDAVARLAAVRRLKPLLVPSAVFMLTVLLVVEPIVARYGPARHGAFRTMDRAVAAARGERAAVVCGDSRSVAAFDFPAVQRGLAARGSDVRLIDLTLESTDVTWQCLALEEFLKRRPDVRTVVLGINADLLLVHEEQCDPSTMLGLLVTNFYWAKGKHFGRLYPDFPRRRLDIGLRFVLRRASHVGAFSSVLQEKWIKLRNRVFRIRDFRQRNRFGVVADMKRMQNGVIEWGRKGLTELREGDGWGLNPLFEGLIEELDARGVRVILVELPMNSEYRRAISHVALGLEYRSWLRRRLAARNVRWIDMSDPAWVVDADFPDDSHITPAGARRFSEDLARPLAEAMGVHRGGGIGGAPQPRGD